MAKFLGYGYFKFYYVPGSGSDSVHPQALVWKANVIIAGGSVSNANLLAASNLLKSLEAAGLYVNSSASIVKQLFIPAGTDSYTGCNVPLIDVLGIGNATLYNYNSGFWTTKGLSSDKTCGFRTGFVPSTHISTTGGGVFCWIDTLGLTTSSSSYSGFGCILDATHRFNAFFCTISGSEDRGGEMYGANTAYLGGAPQAGFMCTFSDNTTAYFQNNGTQYTGSAINGAKPTIESTFGSIGVGSTTDFTFYGGTYRMTAGGHTDAMTTTQATALYSALATYYATRP